MLAAAGAAEAAEPSCCHHFAQALLAGALADLRLQGEGLGKLLWIYLRLPVSRGVGPEFGVLNLHSGGRHRERAPADLGLDFKRPSTPIVIATRSQRQPRRKP